MSVDAKLQELGITLPEPPVMGGNYVSAKTTGQMVYLSGVVSLHEGAVITGKAGVDATVEEGYAAARSCALTQLAVLKRHLGSLDEVAEVVTVNGYVNAAPDFTQMPQVINGASDVLVEILGEAGRHVRAALGVSALPRNALVELQMTVRIH